MRLVLVRGLPGSGKSTFANQLAQDEDKMIHLEADMWFVDEKGQYNFDGSKIRYAHEWCQKTASVALGQDADIVVSNTFTTLKEMQFYLTLAAKHGIKVEVYRMSGQYGSIHNVPADVIEKMLARFEPYQGEIVV